ncbi:hypothetical protein [Xylophilus sp.]|uniref:hypothetical protein n=1 Tax=Xylophilus sp. TaxID=2653893 RepID=UPI002D810856|nr:hypothetical protein [Xylophilus sp.]
MVRHHCIDICASISSIFLSVTARSSVGREARLLWKKEGRPSASCSVGGAAAPQLAQVVELAAADEVVAPLALDHRLEHLAAVGAVALALGLVEFGPVDRRVPDEPDDLGEQAARRRRGLFLAHGAGRGRFSRRTSSA